MAHHKHEQPHGDDIERTDPVAGGDDVEGTHAGGEGEGFLDKVKEFFTGGPEDRRSDADVEDRAETDLDAPPAADAPTTDSVADSTGSVGSGESGWDGSDEPPELTVPENDAVAAHSEATSEDEGSEAVAAHSDATSEDEGSDAYESRHGNGVDDSGVLADAPLEDESDVNADGGSEGDDESDADREQREAEESAEADERKQREEEFAREHDPETHDLEAGDEFRQPGDWTADEHGGPQVQDADGSVHDPGTPETSAAQDDEQGGDGDVGGGEWGASESSGESGSDEVRDGGHGWGSAAPVEGGAMPLGHPVKAWHDTMTFVLPGEDGYEGSDPHEWFVDEEAAQRAGFRRAHGG